MSGQFSNLSTDLVSTKLKMRAAFLMLGIISWFGAKRVTDDRRLQLLVLHGIGSVAPIINEFRD